MKHLFGVEKVDYREEKEDLYYWEGDAAYTVRRGIPAYGEGKFDKCPVWGCFCLCLLNINGMHRCYMGDWCCGLCCFLTNGFLCLGNVCDLFNLNSMIENHNDDIIRQINLNRTRIRKYKKESSNGDENYYNALLYALGFVSFYGQPSSSPQFSPHVSPSSSYPAVPSSYPPSHSPSYPPSNSLDPTDTSSNKFDDEKTLDLMLGEMIRTNTKDKKLRELQTGNPKEKKLAAILQGMLNRREIVEEEDGLKKIDQRLCDERDGLLTRSTEMMGKLDAMRRLTHGQDQNSSDALGLVRKSQEIRLEISSLLDSLHINRTKLSKLTERRSQLSTDITALFTEWKDMVDEAVVEEEGVGVVVVEVPTTSITTAGKAEGNETVMNAAPVLVDLAAAESDNAQQDVEQMLHELDDHAQRYRYDEDENNEEEDYDIFDDENAHLYKRKTGFYQPHAPTRLEGEGSLDDDATHFTRVEQPLALARALCVHGQHASLATRTGAASEERTIVIGAEAGADGVGVVVMDPGDEESNGESENEGKREKDKKMSKGKEEDEKQTFSDLVYGKRNDDKKRKKKKKKTVKIKSEYND